MKSFNIEEIKKYLLGKDSLGDAIYFLSEDTINRANRKNKCHQCGKELTDREFDLGNFCDYCVGE